MAEEIAIGYRGCFRLQRQLALPGLLLQPVGQLRQIHAPRHLPALRHFDKAGILGVEAGLGIEGAGQAVASQGKHTTGRSQFDLDGTLNTSLNTLLSEEPDKSAYA